MNRTNLYILALLVSTLSMQSCGSESSEKENSENAIPSDSIIQLSDSRIGYYLVDDYLKVLGETQSPKATQHLAYFSGLILYARNDSAFMNSTYNFHEGGSEMLLHMISANMATAVAHPDLDAIYTMQFNDDQSIFIKADDWSGKLLKCSSNPDINLTDFYINRLLLGRNYQMHGSLVKFNPDGTLDGFDSLKSYYIHTDYMGPGMEFDMIDLWSSNSDNALTYGFEISPSGMTMFELDCKTEEDGMCVENTRGITKYELINAD